VKAKPTGKAKAKAKPAATTKKKRARNISPSSDNEDDEKGRHLSATQEIAHAFHLFTHYRYNNNNNNNNNATNSSTTNTQEEDQRITLADLRRIARELREDVDDKVLRMMIEEANGETGRGGVERGVGRREFEGVMRRAGVFG